MSDDPILAALARLEAGQARIEAEQTRLRGQLNDKMDNILDQMTAMRADLDTARGQVLYGLQDSLTLGQRVSKIENELRRRGEA